MVATWLEQAGALLFRVSLEVHSYRVSASDDDDTHFWRQKKPRKNANSKNGQNIPLFLFLRRLEQQLRYFETWPVSAIFFLKNPAEPIPPLDLCACSLTIQMTGQIYT